MESISDKEIIMEKQRLDKIEATQQIMLDSVDELKLLMVQVVNREQEVTAGKFRSNQPQFDQSESRYSFAANGIGASQGAIP